MCSYKCRITDVIKKINNDIYDLIVNEDGFYDLKYMSDGRVQEIYFVGICVWNSHDDLRKYIPETDKFETLEECVRRNSNNILDILRDLVL